MIKNRFIFIFVAFFVCGCGRNNAPSAGKKQTQEKNAKENVVEEISTASEDGDYEYEIIDQEENGYFDGNMYFFDLNVSDSIEMVKEKLAHNNCAFEEGTDYAGVHKIWNKGIVIEEWENMDFMLEFYNGSLVKFTKWDISLEQAQTICNCYGKNFDVSSLKNPQSYTFKKGKYLVSIGNIGYYDALHKRNFYVLYITDSSLFERVQEIYNSFE